MVDEVDSKMETEVLEIAEEETSQDLNVGQGHPNHVIKVQEIRGLAIVGFPRGVARTEQCGSGTDLDPLPGSLAPGRVLGAAARHAVPQTQQAQSVEVVQVAMQIIRKGTDRRAQPRTALPSRPRMIAGLVDLVRHLLIVVPLLSSEESFLLQKVLRMKVAKDIRHLLTHARRVPHALVPGHILDVTKTSERLVVSHPGHSATDEGIVPVAAGLLRTGGAVARTRRSVLVGRGRDKVTGVIAHHYPHAHPQDREESQLIYRKMNPVTRYPNRSQIHKPGTRLDRWVHLKQLGRQRTEPALWHQGD